MNVIHDALSEAMESYVITPTGYYVNYILTTWGGGQESHISYYIGPYPKAVAEFLREHYLPTLSTYSRGEGGTYVIQGGDKKKPFVLACIEDGYTPGPILSKKAILEFIKGAFSGSSILGAYVELQHSIGLDGTPHGPRLTAKEVRVKYNLYQADCTPERHVHFSFRDENGNSLYTFHKFLEVWWAPMGYDTVKYIDNDIVAFVPKGELLPYPWWLVEESWNKRPPLGDSRAYKCLLIHIALGYGTSAVLSTFPKHGTPLEQRAWIIGKLMDLPPDYLRIVPVYQNVDGQVFQWPFSYKSHLLASLPIEGIRAVLEGPVDIKVTGTNASKAEPVLSKSITVYLDNGHGHTEGNLLLLEDRTWAVRTDKEDIPVDVAPYIPYRKDPYRIHVHEGIERKLLLDGEITILLKTTHYQRKTFTITNVVVEDGPTEVVYNPGITVTIGEDEVEVERLVRSEWDKTYLFLKGVRDCVSFDILHRAAWFTHCTSGLWYQAGLITL